MKERINDFLGVDKRREQIQRTWKTGEWEWGGSGGIFRANDLAKQEKWGIMTTYLSPITFIPAVASAFFNPAIGGTLIAADVAVGVAGWIRSRQAITAVQQEKSARHL